MAHDLDQRHGTVEAIGEDLKPLAGWKPVQAWRRSLVERVSASRMLRQHQGNTVEESATEFWADAKAVLEPLQSLFTILAILAAGGWAYYHYFRGRTYRARLELSIDGDHSVISGRVLVVARARVQNVGLSRVILNRKGTGLRVSFWPADAGRGTAEKPLRVRTIGIFTSHGWVEPGELIEEQHLMPLPGSALAVKFELRLVSKHSIEWNASRVVVSREGKREERDGRAEA